MLSEQDENVNTDILTLTHTLKSIFLNLNAKKIWYIASSRNMFNLDVTFQFSLLSKTEQ
jgi:hypothetical protein